MTRPMTSLAGRIWGVVAIFLGAHLVSAATAPPVATTPPAAPAPATQPAPAKLSFPTFGIEFTPPAGWSRQFEPDIATVAQFAPADNPKSGLVQIHIVFLDRPTARQQIEEEARQLGGVIEPTTLGGVEAFRVRNDKVNAQYIAAGRGGCIYEVFWGHNKPANAAAPAAPPATPAVPAELEAVRTSWHWLDPQSPANHTELDPEPVLLFDRFAVLLPTWARPEQRNDDGEATFQGIHYGRLKLPEDFAVTFSLPPGAQGIPFDQVRASAEATVLKISKAPGPMVWKPVGRKGDRIVSDAVIDRTRRNEMSVRKAIIAPDAQTRLLVTFSVWTTDLAERAAYGTMEEKIVESIEPVAAAR
jgi:hypothetical protein